MVKRMIKSTPKAGRDSVDLIRLIRLYKKDPKGYGDQMTVMVDKIINHVCARAGYKPLRKEVEEGGDLKQELRLICFKLINDKINVNNKQENPFFDDSKDSFEEVEDRVLNKRAFNYLRIVLAHAITGKMRHLFKVQQRSPIEQKLLSEDFKGTQTTTMDFDYLEPFPGLFSEDSLERKVSNMLANGYTKIEVKEQLNLKGKGLEKILNSIKSQIQ
jgi:hypothetical protein